MKPQDKTKAGPITPSIWLLIGDKLGDNAQIEIIAEALNLPFKVKRVLPMEKYVFGKPRFKPSLYHLDLDRSDKLRPPWPDLILTIGRRPAMAALWVQEQSGGRSKIVLLGRPKGWQERFSLFILSSQYRMPDDPKVLTLDLPLMRSNAEAITQASERWHTRFTALPRPLTALLIGGPTKPFRFDAPTTRELLALARRAAGNGFLYITTSRRTPPAVINTLQENLSENTRLHCWSAEQTDNPYLALLGLADRFIVTGDSISMMVEVARLGKPLAIFALPEQRGALDRLTKRVSSGLHASAQPHGLLPKLGRAAYRRGLLGYGRDLTTVHRVLMEKGLAVPLGQPFPAPGPVPPDEVALVVSRIRALLRDAR